MCRNATRWNDCTFGGCSSCRCVSAALGARVWRCLLCGAVRHPPPVAVLAPLTRPVDPEVDVVVESLHGRVEVVGQWWLNVVDLVEVRDDVTKKCQAQKPRINGRECRPAKSADLALQNAVLLALRVALALTRRTWKLDSVGDPGGRLLNWKSSIVMSFMLALVRIGAHCGLDLHDGREGDLVKMQEDRGFSNSCVTPLVLSSCHLVLIHLRVGVSMSRLR